MTGKEALKILEDLISIRNFLLDEDDRSAFFNMGILTEELAQIVRIDEVSFNPTIKREE